MHSNQRPPALSRRSVLGGAAAGVSVALLSAGPAGAHPGGTCHPHGLESFGTPIQDVTTTGGCVGTDGQGRTLLFTVASGSAGSAGALNAVDPNTGDVVGSAPLADGVQSAWGVVPGPDGAIYVGTNGGHLLRWTVGAATTTDLGTPLPEEKVIYQLSFDADGWLYGGTYPGGRVFRYHPETGEVRDYGQAFEGQAYARSTVVHGGTVYAGTQPSAHLVAFDVATGERRELTLPENIDRGHRVYDLNVRAGLLFARISQTGVTGTLVVYDVATETVVGQVTDVGGLSVSAPGPDGRVYLVKSGEVTGYDPATGELSPTGLVLPGRVAQFRGVGWARLDLPDHPGDSLVGMGWKGYGFRHNPGTGAGETFETAIEKVPVRIRALAIGPDRRVYVGGTGVGGLAMVHPRTGEVESHRFGEHQGIATHRGEVYLGLYPQARIYHYDPDRPFHSAEYTTVPPGGTPNPVLLFDGDPDRQDRPFAMTSAGRDLAVGTVPSSGLTGGTLTLYDPRTGRPEVHRDLVPDQSVVSLVEHRGTLYGGSSVYGGYGAPEPASEAVLFAFDPRRGRVRWRIVPVPGERAVSRLDVDRRGYLWGLTAGVVFRLDPRSREVVTRRYADYEWPADGAYVVGDLAYNRVDGHVYATIPNHGLVRIDPWTWRTRRLSDRDLYRLVVDRRGDVFVSDGAELLRHRAHRR